MSKPPTLAQLAAYARFTHSSFDRHVLQPNRAAGARCRVVIHSWSPEVGDVLDSLYQPAASEHAPPLPKLDKVASQHTSMGRALQLLRAQPGEPDALVLVARLDVLFYSDVPLAALAPSAAAPSVASGLLYLPHSCVASRLVLTPERQANESRALRRTCSGNERKGMPTGRRMLPPQLTRYSPGVLGQSGDLATDLTHFVLDYFFVATPAVAASFATVLERRREYEKEIGGRLRNRNFPHWSHLYWAHHVTRVLVPSGVQLRWLMMHEVDFTLARFWRYGADCIASLRHRSAAPAAEGGEGVATFASPAAAAADAASQAAAALEEWDEVSEGTPEEGSEARAVSRRKDAAAWRSFRSVSMLASKLRGAGEAALAASPLAEQCPLAFRSSYVLCPWYSRACSARHASTLAMAEQAGQFQTMGSQPARQLLGAERCHSPVCRSYEGTARVAPRVGRSRARRKGRDSD